MPGAVLLVGHRLVIGRVRLHVVERRHGPGGVAEGGMRCDVVDALAADIDDAAVAQQFEVLFSSAQHGAKTVVQGRYRVKAGTRHCF